MVAQTTAASVKKTLANPESSTHGPSTGNDFAMLRLFLLALLPQIGGMLLMVGRSAK
jgi:hypothetical protein